MRADTGDDAPGLWASVGSGVRLLAGWFCVAIGVLNLLVDADRITAAPDRAYVLFHVVLVAGGALLLAVPHLGRSAGTPGFVAGGVVAAAGMVAGALPVTNTACCLSAFDERHGYPFSLAARNDGSGWHVDGLHVLADLLFWGYVGLVALVAVALVRRLARPRPAGRPGPPRAHTHAESRAYAAGRARQEQPADD